MIRWHSIVGYSVVGYSVVGYSVVGNSVVGYSGQTSTEYPLHIMSYIIRWHSIVGYSGHFARNTQRPKYPTFLLGILVVGYSRRWVFPMLGIPYSYRVWFRLWVNEWIRVRVRGIKSRTPFPLLAYLFIFSKLIICILLNNFWLKI